SPKDEHKTCTFTQTSSETVTILTCIETPSYETRDNRISRHHNNDRKDKEDKDNSDCKETITVTFTPTIT
ncbi:6725_t:CDS:1, partial [Cetraspora pellucida]